MNRHERRATTRRVKSNRIRVREIWTRADVIVDAKLAQIVMIFANAKGRKVVEDLWPDVEWTIDPIFASSSPPDWQFTHVRVTKLPPYLEKVVALPDCAPDALGLAVATAIQRMMAEPLRVAHLVGHGAEMQIHFREFGKDVPTSEVARSLFVEYAPSTLTVGGAA